MYSQTNTLFEVGLAHGLFGAFADAFAALDAEGVVDDGVSLGVLGDGAHGTCLNQWTHMVVRTNVFIYLYHSCLFFDVMSCDVTVC